MTGLYSFTAFLSAWLLFSIQPMIARTLLPDLGGAPIVWNICVFFFQTVLLGGYAYAHWTSRQFRRSAQCGVHLALLAAPLILFAMNIHVHEAPLAVWPAAREWLSPNGQPVIGMLGVLAVSVGWPCFVLAATSPLLQRWYVQTGGRGADDPYFLYAASNLGSLAALVSYPLLVEKYLPRQAQSWTWSAGYVVFAGLTAGCALAAGKFSARASGTAAHSLDMEGIGLGAAGAEVSLSRKLRWLALSALPSSLLLGVTAYVTTDIAAVPLLWIIPLVLYLLSFVIAFSRRRVIPHHVVLRYLPLSLIFWAVTIVLGATEPASILLSIHLIAFFWAALACHGGLYRDRPAADDLTLFYLMVSLGGAVGGCFNAFVAPLIFDGVFEYHLAMIGAYVAAKTFSPTGGESGEGTGLLSRSRPLRLAADAAVPLVAILCVAFGAGLLDGARITAERALTDPRARYLRGTVYTVPLVWCLVWSSRTIPFVLGVGTVLLVVPLVSGVYGRVLHVERTWFGVHRVTVDAAGDFHLLIHGNTIHGRQRWSPEPSTRPGSYYHPDGPVGDLFRHIGKVRQFRRIAVVGLGAGSLASYALENKDQHWTFYEIDPAVVRIAKNPRYFTFLHEAFPDESRLDIVVGDARLKLTEAPDGHFNAIVLDAFSSDAIPVHLLTREALELYWNKLARGGLLIIHISNRHLELRPLVAAVANAHSPPLVALGRDDTSASLSLEQQFDGRQASEWAVMARHAADVEWLPNTWQPLITDSGVAAWTDEYASIFAVAKDSIWPGR